MSVTSQQRKCVTSPSPPHATIYTNTGLQLSGEVPPPDVEKNLLEKFSELLPDAARKPGKVPQRRVTSRMKDKILLHLLVLTLILDDFSVECSTLQQDLKVTTKK